MAKILTENERKMLLVAARKSIEDRVVKGVLPQPDVEKFPPLLREKGACFVTLTKADALRGCVGSLEAERPLIADVCDRAAAAAVNDFRFPPVSREELPEIRIEISRLTSPELLAYQKPEELPGLLQPGKDGVVLSYGPRKATFLPQVWKKLPEPEIFLDRLCLKMGLDPSFWRKHLLEVEIYQVEKFSEEELTDRDLSGN